MDRPYNGYYRPIEKKAAALVESMGGNHGFIDGNKRTAVILICYYRRVAIDWILSTVMARLM
jgi:prophage maintenance system killer protein